MTMTRVTGNLKDGLGEPALSRALILERIEYLLSLKDHAPQTVAAALSLAGLLAAADELISLLELADCGAVGGFGRKYAADGQPIDQQEASPTYSLRDRCEWLRAMPLRPHW